MQQVVSPVSPSKKDVRSQAVSLFFSDMLSEMEEDFQKSGDMIMNRMRAMGSKMDGLEQSISDLMHDAGLDKEDSKTNDVVPSSPIRRPASNSSPSDKMSQMRY